MGRMLDTIAWPRPGAHRWWRAVGPCEHPRAVPLAELGQRSAARERTKGWPGVPTRGSCAPGRPRLPSVCTRPSFAISVTWWAPVGEVRQAPEDLQCACLAGGAGWWV